MSTNQEIVFRNCITPDSSSATKQRNLIGSSVRSTQLTSGNSKNIKINQNTNLPDSSLHKASIQSNNKGKEETRKG